LEGLRTEIAGIFYGHLEYFTVMRYIIWPLGNVVVIWYISPRFGKLCQEKSGNPVINVEVGQVADAGGNASWPSDSGENRLKHRFQIYSFFCDEPRGRFWS
jgi:hypothetical protein